MRLKAVEKIAEGADLPEAHGQACDVAGQPEDVEAGVRSVSQFFKGGTAAPSEDVEERLELL